jgi:CBS domain-containing protein
MSKSKRELESQTDQPEQPARAESPVNPPSARRYLSGRESASDFPRASTSRREGGRAEEARGTYGSNQWSTGEGGEGRFGGSSRTERGGQRQYGYQSQPWDERDQYERESREHEFARSRRQGDDRDYYNYRGENDREPSGWPQSNRGYLRCREIMTKDVTTCTSQTSLRDVADKMEDEDVGSIPVVDQGRLVGIVTDRDIVCRVLAEGRDSRTATAADAMSEELVTCGVDEPVHEAIRKMAEVQVRRLPVVDVGGRLRGIISLSDIALEAERDRELAIALEEIARPTPRSSRRW